MTRFFLSDLFDTLTLARTVRVLARRVNALTLQAREQEARADAAEEALALARSGADHAEAWAHEAEAACAVYEREKGERAAEHAEALRAMRAAHDVSIAELAVARAEAASLRRDLDAARTLNEQIADERRAFRAEMLRLRDALAAGHAPVAP